MNNNDDIINKHRDIRPVDSTFKKGQTPVPGDKKADATTLMESAEKQVESANVQLSQALDKLRDNIDQKFQQVESWIDRARRPLSVIQRRPATFFTFFVVGGVVYSIMKKRGIPMSQGSGATSPERTPSTDLPPTGTGSV